MNFNDKSRYRLTCEALGCDERATTQIFVGVGESGNIILNLCENCAPRFREDKKKVCRGGLNQNGRSIRVSYK